MTDFTQKGLSFLILLLIFLDHKTLSGFLCCFWTGLCSLVHVCIYREIRNTQVFWSSSTLNVQQVKKANRKETCDSIAVPSIAYGLSSGITEVKVQSSLKVGMRWPLWLDWKQNCLLVFTWRTDSWFCSYSLCSSPDKSQKCHHPCLSGLKGSSDSLKRGKNVLIL